MESLKPPESMKFDGNLASDWQRWLQSFEICEVASGLHNKEEKKNIIYERLFFTRNQTASETIDEYVTDLRNKARTCEFAQLKDSLIKDKIVCGIKDDVVRARLLHETELTLEKALDICRSAEISAHQMKIIKDEETAVNLVKKKLSKHNKNTYKEVNTDKQKTKICSKCGTSHEYRMCPAYGKICHKCKKANHFASQCKSNIIKNEAVKVNKKDRQIKLINHDSEEELEFYVGTLNLNSDNKEEKWTVDVNVNKSKLNLQLDTGAMCNVISKSKVKLLNAPIQKSEIERLVTFSGNKMDTLGKVVLNCQYGKNNYVVELTSY
ncbi:uncharacterized protein LOC118204730 [Stegodyphus dumicola]|uniref:uncharacterized protein LOC118204730 n=1 Tax=Stegodyphus dumicola TaxID=202533 RepID=UPI0015AF8D11|nr:uncharacterized protein LOC118204730 [Stegodyphus dumicola]